MLCAVRPNKTQDHGLAKRRAPVYLFDGDAIVRRAPAYLFGCGV